MATFYRSWINNNLSFTLNKVFNLLSRPIIEKQKQAIMNYNKRSYNENIKTFTSSSTFCQFLTCKNRKHYYT